MSAPAPFTVLWLQSGGCGGCTMSLLCAEAPDLSATLASANIRVLWHPTRSEETGAEALAIFEAVLSGDIRLDALCVEGAMLRGPNGTGRFHPLAGTGTPTIDWVRRLAQVAETVVAVGTCAAYGGSTAAGSNPADACGLQYDGRRPGGALGADFRARSGLPVVNVAGCPTHPNWVTETLMLLAAGLMREDDLDRYGRPAPHAHFRPARCAAGPRAACGQSCRESKTWQMRTCGRVYIPLYSSRISDNRFRDLQVTV